MELNLSFHPKQCEVWEDTTRFRVLVAGRRFGKTVLAVRELFRSACENPNSLNWYISPTYKQSKMIAWKMIKDLIPQELIKKANESELSINLINKSEICLKGADNEDNLRGVGVKFAVLDEFAMMKPTVWGEVVRPMVVDTNGRALFIGTPKGHNALFEMYERGRKHEYGFRSWLFTTKENPYIQPDEIEMARKEMPDSMFRQEFECSFLADEERVLIPAKDIEGLKGAIHHHLDTRRIVACDPSQGGDECVIYAIENSEIIGENILHVNNTMEIAGEIVVMMNKYQVNTCCVDGIGIGVGICDRLRELGVDVVPIISSEKAMDKDRFQNTRSEMWWYLMEQILARNVEYPDDPELRRELSAVKYRVTSSGKLGLEPKDDTKERLTRSPDRADTFVYGIWALKDTKIIAGRDAYADSKGSGEVSTAVTSAMVA